MSTLNQVQVGKTCQYFSLLHLMEVSNRGALDAKDFKDGIQYIVNKSSSGSGFIASYCSKPKNARSTFISALGELVVDTYYYVDNKVHAVIMRRVNDTSVEVWNPQLATDATIAIVDASLRTNGQRYPSARGALDVWCLKGSLADDAAERNRQIDIFNALSTYLRGNADTAGRQANIATAAAGMNIAEKKAFVGAMRILDNGLKLADMKAALGI